MLPRSTSVLRPGSDLGERFRLQVAWPPLSIPAAADKTRLLENLQMAGDRRETDGERLGQFEHGLAVGQPTHDRATRRVRQGSEHDVEPIMARPEIVP